MTELYHSAIGDGRPLLILHGLFGSSRNWQSQARRLAEDWRVISVDLRNHGQSFHAAEMNYDIMAEDVARLVSELGFPSCHVLGHSMGGKTAMALAIKNPALIDGLVIADIAPVTYRHHHLDLVDAVLELPLDSLGSRSDADRLLGSRIADASLRAFLLQNLVREAEGWRWRVNWRAIRYEMASLTGFIDLAPDWQVACPALFIRGANSDYVGENELRLIERHFSRAEFSTVADAGHWLHAEQPRAFLERVLEFLARV